MVCTLTALGGLQALCEDKDTLWTAGEIIAMQGLMNMIFEVQDLAVASPATVSRCGMVYVQPSLLGWRPVLSSWMVGIPDGVTDELRKMIVDLFEWLIPPTLRISLRQVGSLAFMIWKCSNWELIEWATKLLIIPWSFPVLRPLQ